MIHPITPPPELVQQWIEQGVSRPPSADYMTCFATLAARWGADMELEACCKLLELSDSNAREFLTATRRPPTIPETIEVDGHTYRLVK